MNPVEYAELEELEEEGAGNEWYKNISHGKLIFGGIILILGIWLMSQGTLQVKYFIIMTVVVVIIFFFGSYTSYTNKFFRVDEVVKLTHKALRDAENLKRIYPIGLPEGTPEWSGAAKLHKPIMPTEPDYPEWSLGFTIVEEKNKHYPNYFKVCHDARRKNCAGITTVALLEKPYTGEEPHYYPKYITLGDLEKKEKMARAGLIDMEKFTS